LPEIIVNVYKTMDPWFANKAAITNSFLRIFWVCFEICFYLFF
jgi:hypothetical protein